ncbi:MAG: cytidine deaminase family protein [Anaerovoracaceae bacterium]|jgi:cytidine deaminase
MGCYPELKHLEWYRKISFGREVMTIREFAKKYDIENENPAIIIVVINKLIKKGKIKLINEQEHPTQAKNQGLHINKGTQSNSISKTKNESQQDKGISFDDCLKKHFNMQASGLSLVSDYINELTGIGSPSLYEKTLDVLKDYKGNFELEDVYLGALIMHVKLGNITGYDLEELFRELNWTDEFYYDVMFRLRDDNITKIDAKAKKKYKDHINASSGNMAISKGDEWESLFNKAKKVQNSRKISPFIDAGGVSSAILTKKGNIYVGVSIETACSLGMCAERNGIANMITNGESQIDKILAIMPDGQVGPPCCACREFLMQLDKYSGDIDVLLDYKTRKTIKLKGLAPEWWGYDRFKRG